jgi:hypothetical protein
MKSEQVAGFSVECMAGFVGIRKGDRANAVLSAIGYNLRLILRWFRRLLCNIVAAIFDVIMPRSLLKTAF